MDNNPGNVPSAKPSIVIAPSQKLPVDAAYACAMIVNPQGTKNVAIPAIVDSRYTHLSFHRLLKYLCTLLGNPI